MSGSGPMNIDNISPSSSQPQSSQSQSQQQPLTSGPLSSSSSSVSGLIGSASLLDPHGHGHGGLHGMGSSSQSVIAGTGHVASGGGPQSIRSRITVVCLECKRLKLKCDRRAPCGSCVKRDTVQRCVYSAAAAEKIDVQSLHNRILVLESQLSAIQSSPAFSTSLQQPRVAPSYDRALIAVGQQGSSLSISLDDVAAVWLEQLDLTGAGGLGPGAGGPLGGVAGLGAIPGMEGMSVGGIGIGGVLDLRPVGYNSDVENFKENSLEASMLDLMFNHIQLFRVAPSVASPSSSSSASSGSSTAAGGASTGLFGGNGNGLLASIGVTPQLVQQLPKEPLRGEIISQLETTMMLHPCIAFPHFRQRIAAMFKWADQAQIHQQAAALGIGLGSSAAAGGVNGRGFGTTSSNAETFQRPSLSFFAAVAAGFAIGAQSLMESNGGTIPASLGGTGSRSDSSVATVTQRSVGGAASASPGASRSSPRPGGATTPSTGAGAGAASSNTQGNSSTSTSPSTSSNSFSSLHGSPHALLSLSKLALEFHRTRHGYSAYDLDFMFAHILRLIYLLYANAGPEVVHELFPLMGYIVNVARMMGLGIDPDEVDGVSGFGLGGGGSSGSAAAGGAGLGMSLGNASVSSLGSTSTSVGIGMGSGHGGSTVMGVIGDLVSGQQPGHSKVKREEGTSRFSLFEKEMRRRLWWDVFYYDLFVSDCMGHLPLIHDDSHTTKFPSDVNEEIFGPHSLTLPQAHEDSPYGNIGYFVQKCRLAQLVKGMKKRTFRDPLGTNPNELSIDAAVTFESEVHQWLNDLPDKFKLNMDQSQSNVAPLPNTAFMPVGSMSGPSAAESSSSPLRPTGTPGGTDEPYLIAQRCEIVTVSQRILLKLFLPFLKRSANTNPNTGVTTKPPAPAMLATINAAHAIVHASRVLYTIFRTTRPVTYVFYCYTRTLFEAAVISASNIIQQPQTVYARVAMEDVSAALEILRDPTVSTGRAPVRGVEGIPSEAVRIIEILKHKAEAVRKGTTSMFPGAGSKRKHEEFDDGGSLAPGFQLPFVGVGVVSEPTASSSYIPPAPVPPDDSSSMSRFSISSNRSGTSNHSHSPHYPPRTKYIASPYSAQVEAAPHPSSNNGGRVPQQKERANKAHPHHSTAGMRMRANSSKTDVTTATNARTRTDSVVSSRGTPAAQSTTLPSAPPAPIAPQPTHPPMVAPPTPVTTTAVPMPVATPQIHQSSPDPSSATSYHGHSATSATPSTTQSINPSSSGPSPTFMTTFAQDNRYQPYEQMYSTTMQHPPPTMYPQQYAAGPPSAGAQPSPAQGQHYYPQPPVSFAPHHGEYDATMSAMGSLSGLGQRMPDPSNAMDMSDNASMGPPVNPSREARYSISSEGSFMEGKHNTDVQVAPVSQPYGTAQPQAHPQRSTQPQGWPGPESGYATSSWDGYTFWKEDS